MGPCSVQHTSLICSCALYKGDDRASHATWSAAFLDHWTHFFVGTKQVVTPERASERESGRPPCHTFCSINIRFREELLINLPFSAFFAVSLRGEEKSVPGARHVRAQTRHAPHENEGSVDSDGLNLLPRTLKTHTDTEPLFLGSGPPLEKM